MSIQTSFRFTKQILRKMDILCQIYGKNRTQLITSLITEDYKMAEADSQLGEMIDMFSTCYDMIDSKTTKSNDDIEK